MLHILELILILTALSTEIFVVSLNSAMSMEKFETSLIVKAASFFTLIQIVFLIGGWFLGSALVDMFEHVVFPVSFAIFSVIGIKLVWEAVKLSPAERSFNMNHFMVLLGASLAAGFNTLIVSIGLNLTGYALEDSIFIITISSMILSVLGSYIGRRYGCRYRGKWFKFAGGIILIVAGLKYLLYSQGIML